MIIKNLDLILYVGDELPINMVNGVNFPFFVYAKNAKKDTKSILFPDVQTNSLVLFQKIINDIHNKTNEIQWINTKKMGFGEVIYLENGEKN